MDVETLTSAVSRSDDLFVLAANSSYISQRLDEAPFSILKSTAFEGVEQVNLDVLQAGSSALDSLLAAAYAAERAAYAHHICKRSTLTVLSPECPG